MVQLCDISRDALRSRWTLYHRMGAKVNGQKGRNSLSHLRPSLFTNHAFLAIRFGVKSVVPISVVIGENNQSLNVKLDSSNFELKTAEIGRWFIKLESFNELMWTLYEILRSRNKKVGGSKRRKLDDPQRQYKTDIFELKVNGHLGHYLDSSM